MPLKKTLRPTKMIPSLRRRRPLGQAFYLTVFAISLLAAFSFLLSKSGGSGAATNGQLFSTRSSELGNEEVCVQPQVQSALPDLIIVPIRSDSPGKRPVRLHPTQLLGRRSRPHLLPPAILLLPCHSEACCLHNTGRMDRSSFQHYRHCCLGLFVHKSEYYCKHSGHERELDGCHVSGLRKWQP